MGNGISLKEGSKDILRFPRATNAAEAGAWNVGEYCPETFTVLFEKLRFYP